MTTYNAMLTQQEEQEKARLIKERSGYKMSKGMDDCHSTFQAIGYAEYHTNKLNDQRPFDRPHGMADCERWRNNVTQDWTYSEKTAKAWAAAGCEVFHYDYKGTLVEVANSKKSTRRAFAGIRIKYTYNR